MQSFVLLGARECSHSYFLQQEKPWETLLFLYHKGKFNLFLLLQFCLNPYKIEMLQEPRCKFIGWVDESNRTCDCIEFRLKVEEQNRRLKFYQAISWFIFVSIVIYKV